MLKPRKLRTFTLAEKSEIIESVTCGKLSRPAAMKRYGIPKSTLSRLLSSKDTILASRDDSLFKPSCKRMRTAQHVNMKKALLLWIKKARASKLPLSGAIIKEKAQDIALQLRCTDFSASDGWLSRFKNRHELVYRSVVGKSKDVPREVCEDWQRGRLRELLEQYQPQDVYNADETGSSSKFCQTRHFISRENLAVEAN
ncbi:tigger transposable element-derived protein 4-like [Ornithodoros turicata]|uniref:tigger transposable element-derived protein 4-like n=1 Tax=Ornithodoros turicata TaxID=34597 RepID=UPI003139D63E